MKNRAIILIVAVNLAALVLLAIFAPHLMISPGKPIDAHEEIADDCFACHTPFIGSTPKKCISCHKTEEIGIVTTKGVAIDKEKKNVVFHQQLIEEDCVACHSDHKGVKAFRPISQFSHNLLESGLQEQCDDCHNNPGDALHREIQGNCSQCHTQDDWLPATFDHNEYFRFDRDHDTECSTCHIDDNYANYTCYGCHEHSRSNIRGEHLEEGINDYENCTECHRSSDEDEAKYNWRSRSRSGNARYRGEMRSRDAEWGRYRHDDDDDDDDD